VVWAQHSNSISAFTMFGNGARTIFFLRRVILVLDARFGVQDQPSCANRPLKTSPRTHLRRGFSMRSFC
jgi:hypothetical protein